MGTSASRAVLVAYGATLCAVTWLGINVAFNYGGNVSGLFWTGAQVLRTAC